MQTNDRQAQPSPPSSGAVNEPPQLRIEAAQPRRTGVRTSSPRPPRRFGFLDALLWLSCAAAYLAVVRTTGVREISALDLLLLSVQAIYVGLLGCGALLLLSRFGRGHTPISAGHWLLVTLACRMGVDMMLPLNWRLWISSPSAVTEALTCWLLVLPTFSRRLGRRWKLTFIGLMFLHSAPLLVALLDIYGGMSAAVAGALAASIAWAKTAAVAAALVGLAAWDVRQREPCGWLHWAGIAAWIIAVLGQIVSW